MGVTAPGGTFTIARDAWNGTIAGTTLGNVTTHQYLSTYGEPDSLVAKVSGTTLYRQTFGRDALGRDTTLTELLPDSTRSYIYRYDARGRLFQVWKNGALIQQLGYDGNSNRTSFTGASAADTATATYDAQDRLLRYRNTEFGWTAAGELAWRFTADQPSGEEASPQPFYGDTTHYRYDELGNLLAVWSPGHDSVSYVIDGQNRRVGRKVNGVLVQGWLYQNGLNPIADLDGSGNVVARYVYGTRGHVPDYVIKRDTAYRIVTDQLGSVRLVVNSASGAVAERRDYDAWGNVLLDSAPSWLTLGYAGGIYDGASGLVRFGARDYDAGVGRWLNKDPIGQAGGINLYAYCYDDPLNLVDPFGLDVWIEGPNRNEPMLHQSINVGDPNGSYDSYSFGINGNGLQGEVYKDPEHGGQIEKYKKLTPEEDRALKDKLERELGMTGTYGITDICRSYSQRKFKEAQGTPTSPPKRKLQPGPSWTLPSTTSRGSSTTGTGTSR